MQLFLVPFFESFHLAFKFTWNQFIPLEQRTVKSNNQPIMSKSLPKAIMKGSQ